MIVPRQLTSAPPLHCVYTKQARHAEEMEVKARMSAAERRRRRQSLAFR